jgi:hypothetical protein
MNISVVVRGGQQARDAFAKLAERARDLKPAYLRAGVAAMTDAQGRIDEQGPGWKPAAMDYGAGTLLHRTGALYRSLTQNADGNIMQDIPSGIRVGTGLKTESGLPIGVLMQDGTGIYGPRASVIRPKGKVLAFTAGGHKFVVRSVKGSPKRPFLYITAQGARKYAQIFADRIMGRI